MGNKKEDKSYNTSIDGERGFADQRDVLCIRQCLRRCIRDWKKISILLPIRTVKIHFLPQRKQLKRYTMYSIRNSNIQYWVGKWSSDIECTLDARYFNTSYIQILRDLEMGARLSSVSNKLHQLHVSYVPSFKIIELITLFNYITSDWSVRVNLINNEHVK